MTAATADRETHAMEADARRLHADGEVRPGEIAIGVIVGRTGEFFDFFVFAIASVLVFPRLMFPFVDAVTGTLYSFAIFALAFVARPIGTLGFLWLDRKQGRGTKLTVALFLLGTATVAMAFLPAYGQVGALAIWLLAGLRILQGIALGGTWDGLASLLAVNAPENQRGWYAMIPQLGAPLGLMVASALFAFTLAYVGEADFLRWGWRYPFFVAFALNVVALFARLRMVVTESYVEAFEERQLEPIPVRETLRGQVKTVVLGAFAPLASFALFHMVTLFPLSYVELYTRQAPERFLVIEMVGAVFGAFAIVTSGLMADRIGRRSLLGWSAAGIALFSLAAPLLLRGGETAEALYMVGGFVLLGLAFGQSSGVVASAFPARSRYTGAALSSDLAWLFGAGFAPFAALWLTERFGLAAAGAYLFSGALATLAALGLSRELGRRK